MQICENIKLAREAKGIKPPEMAKLLGVARTTYLNWEKETEPDLTTIKSIAEKLSIPAYMLLAGIIEFGPPVKGKNQQELQKVKESLRTLTLVVGRMAGLSKEQTYDVFWFSPSGNILEDQAHREITKGKPKGKSSKKNK